MKKIHEYGYDSNGQYRYYPDPPTARGVPAFDAYHAEIAEREYQEEKAKRSKKGCAEVDAQIEAVSRVREEQSFNLLILC